MDFHIDRSTLKARAKALGTRFLIMVIAIVLVGGAYGVGYSRGRAFPETIIVKGITNIGDKDATADFGLFWDALRTLKEKYLHAPDVKDQDLVYGAIEGMTNALGDPYTVFVPPKDTQAFDANIKGTFGGIGASIGTNKDKQIVVIEPLQGSPASHAGLKAGDAILRVDGKSTKGLDVGAAVDLIRGLIGTNVTLSILPKGLADAREITIKRAVIRVPSTKLTFTTEGFANLILSNFNENSTAAFADAATKILAARSKGIILDLRDNPGGYLISAVDIAGWFLEPGKLVATEEFRSGEKDPFMANGNGALKDIPLVILVNGNSASAAEILAGALHDNRGAKLVGEKTFGKGVVQEVDTLSDGKSELKITIAEWRQPGGAIISKDHGITPDVEVKPIEPKEGETAPDAQLEKAIQVLQQEIAQ